MHVLHTLAKYMHEKRLGYYYKRRIRTQYVLERQNDKMKHKV